MSVAAAPAVAVRNDCADKHATKLVANQLGITMATGTLAQSADDPVELELPVMIKPLSAGSNVGVSFVEDPAQLRPAIEKAPAVDSAALVKQVITDREIDIAVIEAADGGVQFGEPLEIVLHGAGVFDHDSKYDGSAQFVLPAPISEEEHASQQDVAKRMFTALDCAGLTRVDFFLTANGPVLNEVNTMPGMTEHSQVPRMFDAVGVSYPELLDQLISSALHNQR